jgi:hypothetical protein
MPPVHRSTWKELISTFNQLCSVQVWHVITKNHLLYAVTSFLVSIQAQSRITVNFIVVFSWDSNISKQKYIFFFFCHIFDRNWKLQCALIESFGIFFVKFFKLFDCIEIYEKRLAAYLKQDFNAYCLFIKSFLYLFVVPHLYWLLPNLSFLGVCSSFRRSRRDLLYRRQRWSPGLWTGWPLVPGIRSTL